MDRPHPYSVTWTTRAGRQLIALLKDARHGKDNFRWVKTKVHECRQECDNRLGTFPDLRERYSVEGQLCNAITLWSVPVQVLYKAVEDGSVIAVFYCRWAAQDTTGPQDFSKD